MKFLYSPIASLFSSASFPSSSSGLLRLSGTLLLTSFLVACGGGSSGSGDGGSGTSGSATLTGQAQNGSFLTGSSVSSNAFTDDLSSSSTTTTDDLGAFSLITSWIGWATTTVTGGYYDVYNDTDVSSTISLSAFHYLDDGSNSQNVNIFTHLIAARAAVLIDEGYAELAAKIAAQIELNTLLGTSVVADLLNMTDGSTYPYDNADLLAFFAAFLAIGGDQSTLDNLTEDFADDGLMNGVGESALGLMANAAGVSGFMAALHSNLVSQGYADPPTRSDLVPFPDWINIAPVADAGVDQSVIEQTTVTLDGTGSSDADGSIASYLWAETTSTSTTLSDSTAAQPTFTAPSLSSNTTETITFLLTVTDDEGGVDTDTVTITVNNLPAQPQNVTATGRDSQVILSWDSVSDATSYEVCQALESISDASSCVSYNGGTLYQSISTTTYTVTSLTNDTLYYFVVIPVNSNGEGPESEIVSATPVSTVEADSTGLINDTGVTVCGDYAYGAGSGSHDNDLDCSSSTDSDGDPVPQQQDALFGRDVDDYDESDGHAGFSFTKIDSDGYALDASESSWSCVKDNITGLIWEVKTDDGGLHDKDDRYNWYSTDTTSNGGAVGSVNDDGDICYGYDVATSSTYCNTEAYVARVQAAGLCGATSTWRMPTFSELVTLVNVDIDTFPTIDADYFLNTASDEYWTSTPHSLLSASAWEVHFGFGYDAGVLKSSALAIRLVRSTE